MSKKRVTLPKNFDELITARDIEALKAYMINVSLLLMTADTA